MASNGRRELAAAIGEVAMASAGVEAAIRHSVGDLIGDDYNWWLFEGQPLETLIVWLKRAIDEVQEACSRWTAEARADADVLLGKVRALGSLRNDVVHGTWWTQSLFVHPEDIAWGQKPRPWGGEVGSDAWYCRRSKRGGAKFIEQAFTLDDLGRLAGELSDCLDAIAQSPII